MMSVISVYSIIVGLGIYYLWHWLRTLARSRIIRDSIVIILAFFVLGSSLFFTLKCRAYFVEDEYNVRIAPVLKTLEYLKDIDGVLVTSEHILFQIYGNTDLKLIDFSSIGSQIPKDEIDSLIRSANVYYLKTMERGGVDEERYQKQYQYIDSKTKEEVFSGNNFKLYRLLRE
jgi:hypothetical protein